MYEAGNGKSNDLGDARMVFDEIEESFDAEGQFVKYDKTHPFDVFIGHIDHIRLLSQQSLKSKGLRGTFRQILYAHCVTTLETYLCDIFKLIVFSSETYIEKTYAAIPGNALQKITLAEIPRYKSHYHSFLRDQIDDLIFHNLPLIKRLFEESLGIDFPDIPAMMRIISVRHDIVHRNGKDKTGSQVVIEEASLDLAIKTTLEFGRAIQRQIASIS